METMKEQFPDFNLEDKVLPDEGGNVGHKAAGITYVRRKKSIVEAE